MALSYVNLIRNEYWLDPGVKHKHVLNIDTTLNLGSYNPANLLAAQLPNRHSPAASPNTAAPQRTAEGGKAHVCNDYNRDSCTRVSCRFTHRCAVCGGAHPQTRCTRGGAQQRASRSTTPRPSGTGAPPVQGTL